MEQIVEYIKLELITVAIVLYFIGMGLKKADAVADKYIPLILGAAGIILCAFWVLATESLKDGQEIRIATKKNGLRMISSQEII